MPEYKNHHYIPKFYLKNFSSKKGLINTYLVKQGKFLFDIPFKEQCKEDYFYGDDVEIEKKFSIIENEAAENIKKIMKDLGFFINNYSDSSELLQEYMMFQYLRTKAFQENIDSMTDSYSKALMAHHPKVRKKEVDLDLVKIRYKNSVIIGLSMMDSFIFGSKDLKLRILKNDSDQDFITSDSPVVMVNPLFDQYGKKPMYSVASKGIIFLFPISPKIYVILYDSKIYYLKNESGVIYKIKKESDVNSLNKIQIVNCEENFYFSNGSDEENIKLLLKNPYKKNSRKYIIDEYLKPGSTESKGESILHGYHLPRFSGFKLASLKFKESKIREYFPIGRDFNGSELLRDPELTYSLEKERNARVKLEMDKLEKMK